MSIPHELHQIKAQEIYEQRIAKGINGSPEGDWETARRYLTRYPQVVRVWRRDRAIAFYRQLLRGFWRRLWRSLKTLIVIIGKILIFPFWLFYKLPQLFANINTRPFALDVVKTIISAASLIAAIIAAIGLFFNILDARQDREDARQDRQLTQERLITDRFTKAVTQIGSDKEEVVIGGIYSLERIAKDSPKDQWTIMEVLTAFVRKNSPIPPEIQELEELSEEKLEALEKLNPVDIQIQAALTVIGRRDSQRDYASDEDPKQNTKRLDLSNSNLRRADLRSSILRNADFTRVDLNDADLRNAILRRAILRNAILRRAILNDADLRNAILRRAILNDADLNDADLRSADLRSADLTRADLTRADFSRADLSRVDLRSAILFHADLRSADLSRADLRSAILRNAELIYTNLIGANLRRANLIGANLRRANLIGANLRRANLRRANLDGANLRRANLDGVENLSNEQIKSACLWEKATYTDTEWNSTELNWMLVDEKANQKRIEEIKQDKASDPKNPPDCSKWK